MPCHPSLRLTEGNRGHWTCVSEHCCNTSRNSIFGSHIVLCCWYCEVETPGKDKAGPSLPERWPWVPVRYKSVRAGQHSSEQVNRAVSNPSGGPQSAAAQQQLLQMLTFANTNSLAFWKTKLKAPPRVFRWQNLFFPGSLCFSAAAKHSPQRAKTKIWILQWLKSFWDHTD